MLPQALLCDIVEPGGEHGELVLRDDSAADKLLRDDARELERDDEGETRRESFASLPPSMRLSVRLPPPPPPPPGADFSSPAGDSRVSGSPSPQTVFSCLPEVWDAGSSPWDSCRTCNKPTEWVTAVDRGEQENLELLKKAEERYSKHFVGIDGNDMFSVPPERLLGG